MTTVQQLNKLYLPPNLRNFIKQNLVDDENESTKMNYSNLHLNFNSEDDYSLIKSSYQSFSQSNSFELKRLPTYFLL